MKISQRTRLAGIAALVLVLGGLFVMVAADKSAPPIAIKPAPAPITASVVAPAEQLGQAFAAVAAHVKPAVVSVYSEKMVKMRVPSFPFPFGDEFFGRFFGQQMPPGPRLREYQVPQSGLGSGMILDKQGHILTNYHVVSDVDEIKVQLADDRSFNAKIVGADPQTDVAVIQIVGEVPQDLPTVQLGDSDVMEAGNLVIAVGAPFGLVQTVTSGIISAKGRSDMGINAFEDFLQTDAPINPGNSGGPLVNMRGEVIGMNSAITTAGSGAQFAGVGFAIPSNMIRTMLSTLVKGGQITRGMLGVAIQDVTKDLAAQFKLPSAEGALVSQVNRGSPAEKAGLRAGDVIVSFNGKALHDTHQLRNLVAATAPGTVVSLGLIRDGKRETVSVTVGQMTREAAAAAATPSGQAEDRLAALGLTVQALTPERAKQLHLEGEQGVVISAVQPGSLAWAANLQAGDLIVEADRMPVKTIGDLQKALDAAANDRILLLIKRQGASLFVIFRLK